ncbi:hypothetical protein VP01_15491g1, partial [Puccinia sorghi]
TSENIGKMMIFEESSQLSNPDRPRIELSHYLKHVPFDDSILDDIARAKLNASYHSLQHTTPAPLLELLDHSPAEEEAKAHNIPTEKADANN